MSFSKVIRAAALAAALVPTTSLFSSMEVTVENDTESFALYLETDYSVKVGPKESHTFVLEDHTTLTLGMDYEENPTPWMHYGLGNGGISYSIDPVSGQSNFSLGLGPASTSDLPDPPPHISLTGGVEVEGTDDWQRGISLQPHGTSEPTRVKFQDSACFEEETGD